MSWVLVIDNAARKQLKKIPRHETERIISAVNELSVNPYSGDIEKMKGEKDVWRRRIGNYRILYEVNATRNIIYVIDVKRRTSSTY